MSVPQYVLDVIKRGMAESKKRNGDGFSSPPNNNQLFLPGLRDYQRPIPNHVARSSLFAPIARGRREIHNETVLVSRSDAVLTYTGEQLDEGDADLCMQLFQFAQSHELGKPIAVTTYCLLKQMGRDTGKQQYLWIRRRMKAFAKATLFIEAKNADGTIKYSLGGLETFRIVERFFFDGDSNSWVYILDPRWVMLFSNREFALIDQGKRLRMGRGHDLAKALQRLIATSSDKIQRYELNWLKRKMVCLGRMRDFRVSIKRAIAELVRVEIIIDGQLENNSKKKEQVKIRISV